MKILFEKSITGAHQSFIWEDGSFAVGDLSSFDWFFSTGARRHRNIIAASEAAGCNLVLEPCAPQAKFWMKHTQHPAWNRILSRSEFSTHLAHQIDMVVKFLDDPQNNYFLEVFQIQQALIDSLHPARVRDDTLNAHGFSPDQKGFVPVPVYDNAHSATGRMSIKEGPKILTLPKENRDRIRSRWDDGELIEIDFNALEARVLGWISDKKIELVDAYEWIGRESQFRDTPRAVIKEATLSAIYGMSRRNFALKFQDTPDAIEVYDSIRKLMRVGELDEKLRTMKRFENAFGRPLGDTNARISHFVQSSAVDVACSGFLDLVSLLDPDFAKPIFLIHDAIVIDSKKCYTREIETICKEGLRINIIDRSFPVKIRRFGHE